MKELPPTLLLVDEADLLRDEGEAYAGKLRMAGVPVTTVRHDGVVHDFMLLNVMSEAKATRAAIAQATAFLREALGTAQPHSFSPTTRPPIRGPTMPSDSISSPQQPADALAGKLQRTELHSRFRRMRVPADPYARREALMR